MKLSCILFFSTLFFYSNYCIAQRRAVYIGVKGNMGFSVPDPNASINIEGKSYALRTHASYAGGMLVQYVLGDVAGIEAGIINTYTSYSRKDLTGSYLQQSLGWDANVGICSYQIPIQLLYITRLRRHPNTRIKLTGGIAMDWLVSDFGSREENPLLVSSMLVGLRIKSRTGKFGHMEYGFEYKYSLSGNYDFIMPTDKGGGTVHTNYSILSLNLYYFFFNRER